MMSETIEQAIQHMPYGDTLNVLQNIAMARNRIHIVRNIFVLLQVPSLDTVSSFALIQMN